MNSPRQNRRDSRRWLQRGVSLRIGGVIKSLDKRICHLLGFITKLAKRCCRITHKAALAIKAKARSVWELEMPPLPQITTTSGAKWESNAVGEWCLLKPYSVKIETAVFELLQYLNPPTWSLVMNLDEKIALVDILTPLVEFGIPLPIEDIERTYCAEYREREIKTMQHIKEKSSQTKPGDTSQNRVNSDNAFGSLEPSADSGVAKTHGVAPQANDLKLSHADERAAPQAR